MPSGVAAWHSLHHCHTSTPLSVTIFIFMPTYEYRCELCGHEMEEFQSMKEVPLVKCPNCGKNGLKRLIGGGSGMIFKGSGFYLTDYKRGNATGKPAPSKSEKPADTKPEAKPETKSETKKTGSSTKTTPKSDK